MCIQAAPSLIKLSHLESRTRATIRGTQHQGNVVSAYNHREVPCPAMHGHRQQLQHPVFYQVGAEEGEMEEE